MNKIVIKSMLKPEGVFEGSFSLGLKKENELLLTLLQEYDHFEEETKKVPGKLNRIE
jgi:hypothetical protein